MWLKIGLASLVALVLGTAPSFAGGSDACGASCCDAPGMHDRQQAAAPSGMPLEVALATTRPTTQPAKVYTCPMHPDVIRDKPGKCPKCGMDLVPKKTQDQPQQNQTPADSGQTAQDH